MHWWEIENHLEPRKPDETGLRGLTKELIEDDLEFLRELWADWED
jgi:hypothetical protein